MEELPDYLDYDLKVVFIGFNPGLKSAEKGHHYASPTNRFWKLLFDSGLTGRRYEPREDYKLLELGYGLTNIVARPTRRAADIKQEEFKEGRDLLKEKLEEYKPEVACFTGIGVYRHFSKKKEFDRGFQKTNRIKGVKEFVVSSPSGLNRTPYVEQLARYRELKEYIIGE